MSVGVEERGGGVGEAEDEVNSPRQADLPVAQSEISVRRVGAKGRRMGTGRIKHRRSNAAVLSVLQGWPSVFCRMSVLAGRAEWDDPQP